MGYTSAASTGYGPVFINDNGDVVGGGSRLLMRLSTTTVRILNCGPGWTSSTAYGINNSGVVAG
jgi:hypothetical protein